MRRKYKVKDMIMYSLFKLNTLSDHDMEIYNRIMGSYFNSCAMRFITKEEHEKIRNSAYKYIIP